uniref:Sodium:calcium antiporter n=1 Tax=Roseihalotalea indica TaxID=2867963 RepID=A0AA49GRB3_9BACT|nr:sodium:calcium antiporter [Tunicatimonas sp. TK19036]
MSLAWAIIAFIGLAAIIAVAGTYLTKISDRLADVTGLGEALVGGVLLGGVTSLSGIVTSVTAAFENHPELAFSNAVGGIAAQTVFLAVADIAYPRANLEHASASLTSLMQGVLLILMLGFVVLVMAVPPYTISSVHPASLVLLLIYIFGTRLISKAQKHPMWEPSNTSETVTDEPDEANAEKYRLTPLLLQFIGLAAVVAFAGYFIAQTAIQIADKTGVSESFLGAVGTSIATSLPELVVSISAVRQGALTLAVSNIIGGNTFDILFLAFADSAYRNGSLYHHSDNEQLFIIALTILLSGVLLLGLLHRQKYGFAKVGWESLLMIALFIGGYLVLYFM